MDEAIASLKRAESERGKRAGSDNWNVLRTVN